MTDSRSLARRFPKDFLFGVATAAYQIEGATREDGRKPCHWDTFSNMPGRVYKRHTGDVACDHYHRWESDLDLIKSFGVDAYRFSIAWPRIIPDGRGEVNQKGLDFYDRLIDGLLERDIKVFPTLYHWDLPVGLAGYGGWTNRDTAFAFADYAHVIAEGFGARIDAIATHNEQWCITYLSHLWGIHAPGEKNMEAALAAVHTTNLAHGLAVLAMRSAKPDLKMGIVHNAMPIYPANDSPEELAAAERAFQFHNGAFFSPQFKGEYDDQFMEALGDLVPVEEGDLKIIKQPLDWWGFNFYMPMRCKHDPENEEFPHTKGIPVSDRPERTDIGWEMDANGMSFMLNQLYDRYDLPPVYITENGACYNTEVVDGVVQDDKRIAYLQDHLSEAAKITESGIPLKGYFLWSLMDNFEWAEGYRMRFGIVHVNYETQVRTIKQSGYWYQDLVGDHQKERNPQEDKVG